MRVDTTTREGGAMNKEELIRTMTAAGKTAEEIQAAVDELERSLAAGAGPSATLTMDELKEMMVGVVATALEPLTAVDRKHVALPGLTTDEVDSLDGGQKAVKFFRSLVKGDVLETRALSEGVDSQGGYLVPEEFRAGVLRIAEEYGLARRLCTVIPMTRDSLRMVTSTSGVTMYWPGESGQITESTPGVGAVNLIAKKMAGIVASSSELLEDATESVMAFMQTLFAESIAEEEDNQLFTGTGNPFTGLLVDASVNVVTMASTMDTFGEIAAADLLDLNDALTTGQAKGAAYFLHKNILTYIRKLTSSTYGPIWDHPAGTIPGKIWGDPYYEAAKLPAKADTAVSTKFVVYGNLKHVVLGDRAEMTVKMATEATIGSNKLFEQDMVGIRVTERIGMDNSAPTAFAVLKTAAS